MKCLRTSKVEIFIVEVLICKGSSVQYLKGVLININLNIHVFTNFLTNQTTNIKSIHLAKVK